MSTPAGESRPAGEPTSEEDRLREQRAAYEAELSRITTADVALQSAVSLLNLGGRRLGLAPGAERERDLEQVRDAVDGVRALMPILERRVPQELRPLRDALSQLQMAYARESQTPPGSQAGEKRPQAAGPQGTEAKQSQPSEGADQSAPGEGSSGPGPAESSGRLWVPDR